MGSLNSRVQVTIQKYKMLAYGERVLVACSGGADSVALFHLLRELAPHLGIRLGLVHFDHALRRGSEIDFRFVRRMAHEFHVPFYGERGRLKKERFKKNLSPEEKARKSRYEFFQKIARRTRIRKIALGHHWDDQAETVLMRLIQGTGLRGLQGIRPVMKSNRVMFIRPLLELRRSEIRRFLKEQSIPYREDPTNQSKRFLRNRIRHQLLPLLERKFNPQIRESLNRLAETAVAETIGLDDWVTRNWRAYVYSRRNGMVRLNRDSFLSLPGVLQFRVLDQVLHQLDPRSGLDFKSWERIEEGIRKGHYRATLPRNLDLNLTAGKFSILRCLPRRGRK